MFISGNEMCVTQCEQFEAGRSSIDIYCHRRLLHVSSWHTKCTRLYKYQLDPTFSLTSFLSGFYPVLPLTGNRRIDHVFRCGRRCSWWPCGVWWNAVGLSGIWWEQANLHNLVVNWLRWLSGAFMILYIQFIQVLRRRPKRSGRIFWGIVAYSSALFPLATLAIIGKINFAELIFVSNRLYASGPAAYYTAHSGVWPNVMTQARWG